MKLRLQKVIVPEKVNNSEYLVEDKFSKESIRICISGIMRMNGVVLNGGDEVYAAVNPTEPNKGRLTGGRDFKENRELQRQKIKLDKKVQSDEAPNMD